MFTKQAKLCQIPEIQHSETGTRIAYNRSYYRIETIAEQINVDKQQQLNIKCKTSARVSIILELSNKNNNIANNENNVLADFVMIVRFFIIFFSLYIDHDERYFTNEFRKFPLNLVRLKSQTTVKNLDELVIPQN